MWGNAQTAMRLLLMPKMHFAKNTKITWIVMSLVLLKFWNLISHVKIFLSFLLSVHLYPEFFNAINFNDRFMNIPWDFISTILEYDWIFLFQKSWFEIKICIIPWKKSCWNKENSLVTVTPCNYVVCHHYTATIQICKYF